MKRIGDTLLVTCFFTLFIPQLFAQLSPFATGLQKYRQGDLEGAIADFETVLATDKENIKAKEYLLNCLIASATKFIQEKEYTKTATYLERALELSPEDSEIKQLYQTVKNKLAEGVIIPKTIPPIAPVVPSPPAPKVEKPPVVVPEMPIPEVTETKEAKPTILPKIEKIIEKITEVRKEISPDLEKKLTVLLTTFEQERNTFQKYLEQREEKEKRIQKQFLILTVFVLLIFSLVFLGTLFVNLKVPLRRAEIVSPKAERKILQLKEKEYQTALEQSEIRLAGIKEKFLQEKNILNHQLEERTKQMEEEREKLKLQIVELQKFSEAQITEIKEKFLEEKNILTKEFEEKIRQIQQEKEKMLSEISKLKGINQEIERQLQEYLKEKKQREEMLRILLFPSSQQRENLHQYFEQWKTKQKNETIAHLLKIGMKPFAL